MKSSSKIEEYGLTHRPCNLLEFPDEVCSIDQISNGYFFPKDYLDNPNLYLEVKDYMLDSLDILRAAQNNPEMEITIYRGAPSNGILNTGDWVTLSKEFAERYAGKGDYSDNINSQVYSYIAKAKELSFDGDAFSEFGYWGEQQDYYQNVNKSTQKEFKPKGLELLNQGKSQPNPGKDQR